jgi:hypothetical protein
VAVYHKNTVKESAVRKLNPLNLSGDKLNALLAMAGQKLGKSPGEIMAQVQSGNVEGLTGGLDPKTKARIDGLLQNPKALEAMLKKLTG